jgi:D-glycero-alpha-D-manno-heptose 1-phosphate guanylyltransferase
MKNNPFADEAVILAGGKGTRLRQVVKDIPKPMALVNGKPFLWHVLTFLSHQGINHFILSVGYKYKVILDYFGDYFNGIKISYAIEKKALGTGGAIKLASGFVENDNFWVVNGDTFLDVNLNSFYNKCKNNSISLALTQMEDFDRYGIVETDDEKIIAFKEKKYQKQGFINAGIYLLKKGVFNNFAPAKQVFSFEKDILEQTVNKTNIGYYKTDSTFIDIGIPEDYYRAQYIFSNKLNKEILFSLDPCWTIFLDRDGVINRRHPGSYIKTIEDFEFIDGAKDAIAMLSRHFNKIIVVTNQQGLGKGMMTVDDFNRISDYMTGEIHKSGGRIDGIYFCSDLATKKPNCRKPDSEMAYKAKKDFPEIDFKKSIMIGDSISDMNFGKNLKMKTILIPLKEEEKYQYPFIEVDWRIDRLSDLI